jgi:hypothetical protein
MARWGIARPPPPSRPPPPPLPVGAAAVAAAVRAGGLGPDEDGDGGGSAAPFPALLDASVYDPSLRCPADTSLTEGRAWWPGGVPYYASPGGGTFPVKKPFFSILRLKQTNTTFSFNPHSPPSLLSAPPSKTFWKVSPARTARAACP